MSDSRLLTEYLPENTKAVFDYFSREPLPTDFTLIGGTAMNLQVGYRVSEDLDFGLPDRELKKTEISRLIRNAQHHGFNAELAMSADQIIAAKINGVDILLYSQDYMVNQVKVTFFSRHDVPYQFFDGCHALTKTLFSLALCPWLTCLR